MKWLKKSWPGCGVGGQPGQDFLAVKRACVQGLRVCRTEMRNQKAQPPRLGGRSRVYTIKEIIDGKYDLPIAECRYIPTIFSPNSAFQCPMPPNAAQSRRPRSGYPDLQQVDTASFKGFADIGRYHGHRPTDPKVVGSQSVEQLGLVEMTVGEVS